MSNDKKIVIADRSPLYREGLKIALASYQTLSFTEVDNLAELVEHREQIGQADIVIIDAGLVRAEEKDLAINFISASLAPVLLLCNQPDLSICQNAKGYGAQGLISKKSSLDSIQRAVQAILAGRSFWPDAGKLSPRKANVDTTKRLIIERIYTLTPKEKVVLPYLIEGKLYKQIAYELGLHGATINFHAANIQRKMHSRNRTHLVSLLKKITSQDGVFATAV